MTRTLELCRSNSIAGQYHEPSVIEVWANIPEEEAERLIADQRPNGFFVREQPEDKTGNF